MFNFLIGYLIGSSQAESPRTGVVWRMIGCLGLIGGAVFGAFLYSTGASGKNSLGTVVEQCTGNTAVAVTMCDAAYSWVGAGSLLFGILGIAALAACLFAWITNK